MRDDGCPECQRLTGGECGRHPSFIVTAPPLSAVTMASGAMIDPSEKEPLKPLTGKEIRKGTGDVLKDLEYAQRFVDGDGVAGMLGLELDFINRALRVAAGEIKQLRARLQTAP